MAMHDLLPLTVAGGMGMVLGAMFFGGLWWTVVRGVLSPRPALWFLGSKLLRTALALGGFYLVGGVRWDRWLLCLVGFVVARIITARLTRPPTQQRPNPASSARYAP
jgi:F1F0 ATPase subunit 2